MFIRVHWDNFLEPIIAQPIIRFFNWTSVFVIFNNSFQFILPQWNASLNHVSYDFISSRILFENFKFSYYLLNIFDIFGNRSPITKRVYAGCKNVSFMYNIDKILSDTFILHPPPLFFVHFVLAHYHIHTPYNLSNDLFCHHNNFTTFLCCNPIRHRHSEQ